MKGVVKNMSKTVKVNNLLIGEGIAKICIPIVGNSEEEIIKQADVVMSMKPDLVEWRCDCFESEDITEVIGCMEKIRKIIGDTPLIFTFRTKSEGGEKEITSETYDALNIAVAKSGLADLIDVEAYSKGEKSKQLITQIKEMGAKVIASNHNFEMTPAAGEIEEILFTMEGYGADICKIAVMPNDKTDVDELINASIVSDEKLGIPVVTMSMSELGAVTRVCTKLTKSAITFAAGVKASAPGQMSGEMVRDILRQADNIRKDKNIMLIGFMGTGKTTVSAALRRITGLEEVDMDAYIVEKEGMSIPEIFEKYGESGFRERETAALKEIQKTTGKIVSCGGGVVLKDENVEIMKKDGIIMLLTASPEVIFDRVKDNTSRPILNSDMSIDHVKRLLEARREKYEKAADFQIDTDHSDRVRTCYDIIRKTNGYK